jgi:hypothetical protein
MSPTAIQLLEAQMVVSEFNGAVLDRDEAKILDLCDRWSVVAGCMRAFYKKDKDSFDWIMWTLSRRHGYEDLICKFWIANYELAAQETIAFN